MKNKKMNLIIRNYIDLNDIISDERKKLSDKYHELELSHNRKKKALQFILGLISGLEDNLGVDKVIKKACEDALFCDGRENERIKK